MIKNISKFCCGIEKRKERSPNQQDWKQNTRIVVGNIVCNYSTEWLIENNGYRNHIPIYNEKEEEWWNIKG